MIRRDSSWNRLCDTALLANSALQCVTNRLGRRVTGALSLRLTIAGCYEFEAGRFGPLSYR